MATTKEIIDYVMESPSNTNPAVLRSLLNQYNESGSSQDEIPVFELTETSGIHAIIDIGDDPFVISPGRAIYVYAPNSKEYALLICREPNSGSGFIYFLGVRGDGVYSLRARWLSEDKYIFEDINGNPDSPLSGGRNRILPSYSTLDAGRNLVVNNNGILNWELAGGQETVFPQEYVTLFEQTISELEAQAQQSVNKSVTTYLPFDMTGMAQTIYNSKMPWLVIGNRKAAITNCTPTSFTFLADDVGDISNNTFPYYCIIVTGTTLGFVVKVTYDEGTVAEMNH